MFADTITITINTVAKALVRINQDAYSSEYLLRETTGEFRMKIRNTSYTDNKRGGIRVDRHAVELVQTLNAVAPAIYGLRRKAVVSFENDATDTVVDPVKHTAGLEAFLSEANLTKMANFES